LNPMNPQLVMFEEELKQIQKIVDRLLQDSRSRTILLIDKNGSLVAASGNANELDTTSLSSLVAGNVAATGGIAKLLQEDEFTGQFHEGKGMSINLSLVGRRIILVVLFDKNTTPGLVRLRVKRAQDELVPIFEALAIKSSQPGSSALPEITDQDIDDLFND
jgi:predicted regulator of Ras-like GTPase activity (Roadblock/LC7/MglB family)